MSVTIEPELKAKLIDEQQVFIVNSIERVHAIDKILDADKVTDSIRFLYIKELYTIFTELRNIEELKSTFEQIENADLMLIYETVKFIRNILAHFPYFSEWDEVWISENLASKMAKGGKTIQKFLIKQKEIESKGVTLELDYDNDGKIETKKGQLKFIKYADADEKIFIKDMVSFRDDSTTLILTMYNFLVRKFIVDDNAEKV